MKQHHDRLQNGRSRGGTGLACQVSRSKPWRRRPVKAEKAGATPVGTAIARHSVSVRRPVSETGSRWFDSSPGSSGSAAQVSTVARPAEDRQDRVRFSGAAVPGAMVKQDHARTASSKSGCDSPWLHQQSSGPSSNQQGTRLASGRRRGSTAWVHQLSGSSLNRRAPALHAGDAGAIPVDSTIPALPSGIGTCL